MPTLDSYLFFDGQCAEAMRFYEQTLGGRMETSMTYAQSPEPDKCPPGSADRIMQRPPGARRRPPADGLGLRPPASTSRWAGSAWR